MSAKGEASRAPDGSRTPRGAFWSSPDWLIRSEDAAEEPGAHGSDVSIRLAMLLHRGGSVESAKTLLEGANSERTSRKVIVTLLASAHLALARASLAAGRLQSADEHLGRFLEGGGPTVPPFSRKRWSEHANARLQELRAGERRLGAVPAVVAKQLAPTWLRVLLAECLEADDPLLAIESALDSGLDRDQDRRDLMRAAAEYFLVQGDRMRSVHFQTRAAQTGVPSEEEQESLSRQLLRAGDAAQAIRLIWPEALRLRFPQDDDAELRVSFTRVLESALRKAAEAGEHGHTVLLEHLKKSVGDIKQLCVGRRPLLLEVGTTREDVPGQGSTLKLAGFCAGAGFHFITVDMDPVNAESVLKALKALSPDFESITAKGEDYLAEGDQPLDAVFLDAYDFDHGKHSALRQARYRKYLGAAIDERQCHQMHLDCAAHVARRLSPHGVVCIDDTWLDNGKWTAKGTLAVPYLLDHGFHILEARNRAVLMARRS